MESFSPDSPRSPFGTGYPEALAEAEAAYGKSDLVTAVRRACDRLDSWLPVHERPWWRRFH